MKFGRDEVLMARICVEAFYQIHPGVDPRQGKKSESFKDKRLYLECCHSGSDWEGKGPCAIVPWPIKVCVD